MKKIFLFAIAAVTMATGCAKLQEVFRPGNDNTPVDGDEPVEIKFTANVATAETKGSGVIAATDGEDNFAGIDVYVFGINQSANNPSSFYNEPAEVVKATAPASGYELDMETAYFYNGTGDYNFYAYYIDDAKTSPALSATVHQTTITIDGQQDILLAKAESTESQKYNATEARKPSNPNLVFEHQLSQFSFQVRNHGANPVTLKSVSLSTVNEGTLTVVPTAGASETDPETQQGIVASTTATALDLPLTMTEIELPATSEGEDDSDWQTVGTVKEGSTTAAKIMVFPDTETSVTLTLYQSGTLRTIKMKLNGNLKATAEGSTDPTNLDITKGKSYDVKITIYSLTEVSMTASLAAWVPVVVDEIDTEEDGVIEEGNDEYDYVLKVDNTTHNVDATENSVTVTVTKKDPTDTIVAEEDEEWITVTGPAEGTSTYTLAITANETGAERTGTVTFRSTQYSDCEKVVKVTQAAAETAGN